MSKIEFDLKAAKEYPRFRVYTRPEPGEPWILRRMLDKFPRSDGNYSLLPTFADTRLRPGCIVRTVSRALLPAVGTAKIDVPFGELNDKIYTLDDEEWNWLHHQVRIDSIGDDLVWYTIFWGTVQRQEDVEPPAWDETTFTYERVSVVKRAGTRSYHCVDLTYDFANIMYSQHYYQKTSGGTVALCQGAASFNTADGSALSANRGTSSGTGGVQPHTLPGQYTAVAWSDSDIVTLMFDLASAAGYDQPWQLADANGQLDGNNKMPADDTMTIRDVITQVCSRKKGVGCAFLDWANTTVGDSDSALLRVYPQLEFDTENFDGATTAGTTQDIVLTGDHRMDDNGFSLGSSQEYTVDEVVTYGERIQIGVTLKIGGGLEEAWGSDLETAYEALIAADDYDESMSSKYDSVYRAVQLSASVVGAKDINLLRYDYRLADDGTLADISTAPVDTSPLLMKILPYYPCGQTIDPKTGDAPTSDDDVRSAPIKPMVFEVYDSGKVSIPEDVTLAPQGTGMAVNITGDSPMHRPGKTRLDNMRFTVGVELPHRVRYRTTASDNPQIRRRQAVFVRGAHLWLGRYGTIIGTADGVTENEADTIGLGASPTLGTGPITYRDDRDAVRSKHELASQWYLTERRQMQVVYRSTCALIPTFTDKNGLQNHPKLGHLITSADIGGEAVTIRCIVSSISYNNGNTKVTTDWKGLQA